MRGEIAPALLTGVAAHAQSRWPSIAAAGTALLLGAIAHGPGGWPIPRGGSAAISEALTQAFLDGGGEVVVNHRVRSPADLPPARVYLFDTVPQTLAEVFSDRLTTRQRGALMGFRHGNGASKVDFVLSGPVPWTNPAVSQAATVHLGGNRARLQAAENSVASGRHAADPMCLVSDPAAHDQSREVGGLRPLWSYAHVPAGSDLDMTETITRQIERYAPGFRDLIVAARCIPAARLPEHNANYVGGDIAGGAMTLAQIVARPSLRRVPFATAVPGVYLCSASTPPGPGVHGLGGWYAARYVLRTQFGL